MQQRIEHLSIRHSLMPEPEELTRFPLKMLPRLGNMNFYGRRDELARIDRYLKWEGNASLRTFCIYGHRGLGKTEFALEFAHRNPLGSMPSSGSGASQSSLSVKVSVI
jgi:hypothetical protein